MSPSGAPAPTITLRGLLPQPWTGGHEDVAILIFGENTGQLFL